MYDRELDVERPPTAEPLIVPVTTATGEAATRLGTATLTSARRTFDHVEKVVVGGPDLETGPEEAEPLSDGSDGDAGRGLDPHALSGARDEEAVVAGQWSFDQHDCQPGREK